jgi:hypothetical protein
VATNNMKYGQQGAKRPRHTDADAPTCSFIPRLIIAADCLTQNSSYKISTIETCCLC